MLFKTFRCSSRQFFAIRRRSQDFSPLFEEKFAATAAAAGTPGDGRYPRPLWPLPQRQRPQKFLKSTWLWPWPQKKDF